MTTRGPLDNVPKVDGLDFLATTLHADYKSECREMILQNEVETYDEAVSDMYTMHYGHDGSRHKI
jgi:hypothetical protein